MSHFICKCSIDETDSNLSLFDDVDGAGQSDDCNGCNGSGKEHNSSETVNQLTLGFIFNDEFIFDIQ